MGTIISITVNNYLGEQKDRAKVQLGQLRLIPPRTWAPSPGSRVRGCVILDYIKRGQQWNTGSRYLDAEEGD